MGGVLSTFLEDYNQNFSYRIPFHIPLDDSSDEDEQFIVYSRVDIGIIPISSGSDTHQSSPNETCELLKTLKKGE